MEKKLYNELVITKDRQGDELATRLGEVVLLLLKEENTCKIRDDDGSGEVIIIEYEHDNNINYWGSPSLEWLTDDELTSLEAIRAAQEKGD